MADDRRARRAAAATALATLPHMGPRRFTALVRAFALPGAWDAVRSRDVLGMPRVVETMGGSAEKLADEWASAAASIDPAALLELHHSAGIQVVTFGDDAYPAVLAADPDPPMVLFVRGDLERLAGTRVGIVGTRRATGGARQTALELGRDLAAVGVRVVSGLALGIDGAAHQGALRAADAAAPPVGVVATGLDVVYPRRHRGLWEAVADSGVLLSEVPMGGAPNRWRFPARNRLIAALSDLVVVVESHASGGALITAEEAVHRNREVMAVPGSVRNPAAAGTNRLIADGAEVVCSVDDVLAALDLSSCDRQQRLFDDAADATEAVKAAEAVQATEADASVDEGPALDPGDVRLLDVIGWEPISLDHLAARAEMPLSELAVRLTRLEAASRVVRRAGALERVVSP